MLPVTKKTIEVSYLETKGFVIKVPSFSVPIHYLKIGGFLFFSFITFTMLTSLDNTTPKLERYMAEDVGNPQVNLGIVEVCGLEKREQYFTTETKIDSKMIAITEIISNKDLLNFLTQGELLNRAYNVSKNTGLDITTILGMKSLESRTGKSSLCAITKNLGNVKCFNQKCKKNNWKKLGHHKQGHVGSHCVQFYDDKPSDRFVRYNTWGEGWKAWEHLMLRKYSKASSKDGSKGQLQTIKALGYATDPSYVTNVQSFITRTGLNKLKEKIDEGYTITSESGKYIFLKPTP